MRQFAIPTADENECEFLAAMALCRAACGTSTSSLIGSFQCGYVIDFYAGPENILTLPTIHVHGLQDPGLHLHRQLLEMCCAP